MADPWYRTFFDELYRQWHQPYEDMSTQQEASGTLALLDLPPGSTLLDVPCGTGRHALAFAAAGLDVTGVDLSAQAIALARRQAAHAGLSCRWHVRDMRQLPWRGQFDAVVCLFNSFGYLGDQGDQAALAAMARALKPGGRLLLDLPNRDHHLAAVPAQDWQETDTHWVLTSFHFELETGRAVMDYTFVPKETASPAGQDGALAAATQPVHRRALVRWYTYQEIEAMLHKEGLVITQAVGDWAGGPLSLEAPKLIVVATKPA